MTYRELNELIREMRGRLDKLCIEPAFVDDAAPSELHNGRDAAPSASESVVGRDAAPPASEAPSAQ